MSSRPAHARSATATQSASRSAMKRYARPRPAAGVVGSVSTACLCAALSRTWLMSRRNSSSLGGRGRLRCKCSTSMSSALPSPQPERLPSACGRRRDPRCTWPLAQTARWFGRSPRRQPSCKLPSNRRRSGGRTKEGSARPDHPRRSGLRPYRTPWRRDRTWAQTKRSASMSCLGSAPARCR